MRTVCTTKGRARRIRQPGWAPSLVGPVAIEHTHGFEDLELELTAGGAIEGRVLVPRGTNPSGWIIGASCGDPYGRKVVVGTDGRYRFDGLTPGPWNVTRLTTDTDVATIQSSRETVYWESNCEVVAGRTTEFDLDFTALAECSLEGRLRVGDGEMRGWTASLKVGGNGPVDAEQVDEIPVAGDGSFTLVADAPGPYYLLFEHAEGEQRDVLVLADLTLVEGLTTWEHEVEVGTVSGTLELSSDEGLALVEVTRSEVTVLALLQPNGSGGYSTGHAPVGLATVRFSPMPPTDRDPRRWKSLGEVRVRKNAEAGFALGE